MGRLIDTSVFDEMTIQGKSEEFVNGAKYILDMIDAQPTAYDAEKVVDAVRNDCYSMGFDESQTEIIISDIVKKEYKNGR